MYCPLLGLGLYGGHRGRRWLRNRIKIFKQFVIPSLKAQTSKNFILWMSVRPEDRYDNDIKELKEYLDSITEFTSIVTYAGVCFWDDKYPDDVAQKRLAEAVHGSLGQMFDTIGSVDHVLMTIQPSDDVYHKEFVEQIQKCFVSMPEIQALGFRNGYVANYQTLEVSEWNPKTIPPFFTIKFPTQIFIEPTKHLSYTGPYKSHEYIADKLNFGFIETRGFLVGTHGENISTHYNHPFKGELTPDVLRDFGLDGVEPLRLRISIRKMIMRKLPHGWQRKLRYWFGERGYGRIYNWLRS